MPREFNCKNCGECCRAVPVIEEDIFSLARSVMKLSPEYRERLSLQIRPDVVCPFRDIEKAACAVYNDRPEICRIYGKVARLRCSNNDKPPAPDEEINRLVDIIEVKTKAPALGILGLNIKWPQILHLIELLEKRDENERTAMQHTQE
jgi:Fe-S-cluster containining protein